MLLSATSRLRSFKQQARHSPGPHGDWAFGVSVQDQQQVSL